MSFLSSILLYFISVSSCFYLSACQNPKPSSPPQSNFVSPTHTAKVYEELTWTQALHSLDHTLNSSSVDQQLSATKKLTLLQSFKKSWPKTKTLIDLKRSISLVSLGQWERGLNLAKKLWSAEDRIAIEARYFIATYATQCSLIETALNSPILDHNSERYLVNKLRLHTHCKGKIQSTKIEQKLALIAPHLFTTERLLQLFGLVSANRALEIAKILEEKRMPEVARELLNTVLEKSKLSESEAWLLTFERERLQVERVRTDFLKSIKVLKRLSRAKKSEGRRASLLLAKAWSKANRPQKAARVYRDLIKEWKHSPEAKTARFNLAFIHYEQKRYTQATRGFAELSRHKGDLKLLKRFPNRANAKSLVSHAEWYYAWSLYLKSPKRAAPFLEALIGDGLPVSAEGRRAAYWASKAYSSHNPQKADQLRNQILKGAWGDWYSLLLRAQDPSLAPDHKPWPLLPPMTPAIYQARNQTDPALSSPRPSMNPQPQSQIISEPHELETLAIQRQLAVVLDLNHLVNAIDQIVPKKVKKHLNQQSSFSPWAIELEQYKVLHSWAVSQALSRLREVPLLDHHEWWRSVYPLAYEKYTAQASQKTGISQKVLLSFIYKESAFAPRAVSHAYAMGLMQILEKTAQALRPKQAKPNLLDPQTNIFLGTDYLIGLSARYHDQLPLIAAAYNAGPKNLNKWLKTADRKLDLFVERIPFREAREYVKKLIAIYCTYQFMYGQQSINTCASQLPLTINTSVNPGINF